MTMALQRNVAVSGGWGRLGGVRPNGPMPSFDPSRSHPWPSWSCALALPSRSGVPGLNKWDGFLQLNDVAVLLFSSEFKLHLPGGP